MAKKRKPRTPAARTIPSSSTILAAGAVRNVAAGMLPLTVAPKVRRQLAQYVGVLTIAKAIAADRKAGVLS